MNRYKITDEQLVEAVKVSDSFAEVLRSLKVGQSGSNHKHYKTRIEKLNLDTTHFYSNNNRNIGFKTGLKNSPIENVLVLIPEDGVRKPRVRLLRAMILSGIEYKCHKENCPNPSPMWNGEILPLEIEHIDGNWRNCLLENLTFLCPNCHSQTDSNNRSKACTPSDLWETYEDGTINIEVQVVKKDHSIYDSCSCGKEKLISSEDCRSCSSTKRGAVSKVTYPEMPVLLEMVKRLGYSGTGRELNISDNAIRKHLIRNGIDPKEIK